MVAGWLARSVLAIHPGRLELGGGLAELLAR
jgi:hypothetical protein